MKKIATVIISLFLGFCFLCGCNDGESNDGEQIANRYAGGASEFHISGWEGSDSDVFSGLAEAEEQVTVPHNKTMFNKYAYIYTSVKGDLADFTYFNLRVSSKSALGRTLTVRIATDMTDEALEKNIIGEDCEIPLSSDVKTVSIKIKGVYRAKLDVARYVCIYPDIGLGGLGADEFYLSDVFFSASVPENYELINPNIDSGGENVQRVNDWSTPTWTKYTLYDDKVNEVLLNFGTMTANWACLERSLDLTTAQIASGAYNCLNFVFYNRAYTTGTKCSIDRIKFILKGDYKRTVSEGVMYEYDEFYEYTLGTYVLSKNENTQDAITVKLDLKGALEFLYRHCKDGLRLYLNVESDIDSTKDKVSEQRDLDGDGERDYDRMGTMAIESVSVGYDESFGMVDVSAFVFAKDWGDYEILSTADGVSLSTAQSQEWSYAYTELFDYESTQTIKVVFENVSVSATNIAFRLRGDVKGTDQLPSGEQYNLYYDEIVYVYDSPQSGEVILEIPVAEALGRLNGHTTKGLWLDFLIESHPDYVESYDGAAQITVKEITLIKGQN